MDTLNPVAARSARVGSVAAVWHLTKPRVVFANAAMIAVGAAAAGPVAWSPLLPALLGGSLVIASATAGNQWFEQDVDARMARTRDRPLPARRITSGHALGAAAVLLVLGLGTLGLFSTPGATLWAAAGWVLYALLYTPAKRITSASMHLGALSGAVTPLLGAFAVSASPDPRAWAVALFVLLWQYPHFMAIGLRRDAEYRASGLAVFTVRHRQRTCVAVARVTALALVLVGPLVSRGGMIAVWTLASLPLALASLSSVRRSPERWSRDVFVASLWSILLLATGVVVLAAVGV